MGMLDSFLFGSPKPSYSDSPLDSGTEELINQQRVRSNTSDEDFAKKALEGTDTSAQLNGANAAREDKQRALGGNDQKAFSDAINNKYQKLYSSNQNDMRLTAKAQSPIQHFNAMDAFRQNSAKRLAVNTERANMERSVKYNQLAARNQAISSIIGAAGTVVGGIFGGMAGGAGGAMSGSQAGGSAMGPSGTTTPVNSGSNSWAGAGGGGYEGGNEWMGAGGR